MKLSRLIVVIVLGILALTVLTLGQVGDRNDSSSGVRSGVVGAPGTSSTTYATMEEYLRANDPAALAGMSEKMRQAPVTVVKCNGCHPCATSTTHPLEP
jgi:hypothetical protein